MSNSQKENNFRKWGWGWFILAGIISSTILRAYPGSEVKHSITYLLGVSFAIIIYFYFRNRVFRNYHKYTLRSFYSGLISYVLTIFFVGVVYSFSSALSTDILTTVAKKVEYETKGISTTISEFQEKDTQLWSRFVEEPVTEDDIENNLDIIDKSIPLYKNKDSVALSTFSKIHQIIEEAESKDPKRMNIYPITSKMTASLYSNYKNYAVSMQSKFRTQKDYYLAVLDDNLDEEQYWEVYAKTYERLINAERSFKNILDEFTKAKENFVQKYNSD